jgi:hypothetical protein
VIKVLKTKFKDLFKNIFKKTKLSVEISKEKKEFEELEKEVKELGNIFEEPLKTEKQKKSLFDSIKSNVLQKFNKKKKVRKKGHKKIKEFLSKIGFQTKEKEEKSKKTEEKKKKG